MLHRITPRFPKPYSLAQALRFLVFSVYKEENLFSFPQAGEIKSGDKLWSYLTWRKIVNPFKFVELICALTLWALDNVVSFAYRWATYLLYLPFIVLAVFPFPFTRFEMTKLGATKVIGFIFSVAAHIYSLSLFVFTFSMDVLFSVINFAINLVLSPVNGLIKPLVRFFQKGHFLKSIGFVLTVALLCALPIAALVVASGGILPSAFLLVKPAVMVLIQLFTPVLTALASLTGMLAAKAIIGTALVWTTLSLVYRVFSGRLFSGIAQSFKAASGALAYLPQKLVGDLLIAPLKTALKPNNFLDNKISAKQTKSGALSSKDRMSEVDIKRNIYEKWMDGTPKAAKRLRFEESRSGPGHIAKFFGVHKDDFAKRDEPVSNSVEMK